MITRKTFIILFSLLMALGVSFQVQSAELGGDYLVGTWVVDQDSCSDASSEFLIFRQSGAVESVRAGKLEAAGFWNLGNDMVDVHVVASPAFFHDDLKVMEGQYYAFPIRVVPFNLEADKFEAIGLLGDQVRRAVFVRCKT